VQDTDLIVIRTNIQQILAGRHPEIRAKRYQAGFTSNPWLLTWEARGLSVVLKDVSHVATSPWAKNFDWFSEQFEFSRHCSVASSVFAKLPMNGNVFVLYEYIERSRPTTFADTVDVLARVFSDSAVYSQQRTFRAEPAEYLPTLLAGLREVLTEDRIKQVVPVVEPETVSLLQRLASYFVFDGGFISRYQSLPIGFVHSDVKAPNVVVGHEHGQEMKTLIDWDFAGPKVRLKEISHCVAIALGMYGADRFDGLLETVLKRMSRSDYSLVGVEENSLAEMILMNMLFFDVNDLRNFTRLEPDHQIGIRSGMKERWKYLHQVVDRNEFLGFPVRRALA